MGAASDLLATLAARTTLPFAWTMHTLVSTERHRSLGPVSNTIILRGGHPTPAVCDRLHRQLALAALNSSIMMRRPLEGWIHFDRGGQ